MSVSGYGAVFQSDLGSSGEDNTIYRPEGWAACSSVYSADDYDMMGGGYGSVIVLRNDGSDMRQRIHEAVMNHDVVVFDGSAGDFVLSSNIGFQSLKSRTLIGVNGASFRTEFYVRPEIHKLLDDLDVKSLSSWSEDNLGGTLSNGSYVAEQCERAVRQALIDYYDDQKETYRNSGIFVFNGCSNLIIRNLDFTGPGSIDLGAADLITLNGCDHIWIDHCRFTDGMDGNLDIINNSDFITVSDTHFRYSERSYNHPLSNLTGGDELTDGSPQKNNISWIRCFWDEGCVGRMPWTGLGYHHLLNCFWDCKGGTSIDSHNLSKLLIEGCYFTGRVGKPLAVRDDNVTYEFRNTIWNGKTLPKSNAVVEMPYSYSAVTNLAEIPLMAKKTGPTLAEPYRRSLSVYPPAVDLGTIYSGSDVDATFNLSAFGSDVPARVTLTAPEGLLLSATGDGEFAPSVVIEATDANLLQADVCLKANLDCSGEQELEIKVSSEGTELAIPVRADVIGLSGERTQTTLTWAFDGSRQDADKAEIANPEAISEATLSTGDKIYLASFKKIGERQFAYFNPTEAISKVYDAECRLTFDVTTEDGYVFIPKTLRFNAARVSTDMCLVDIDCVRGAGNARRLLTGFQPVRSSDAPYYSELELPLSGAGVGDNLQIRLYLYNMSANKQLALNDFTIIGEICRKGPSAVESPVMTGNGEIEYFDFNGRRVSHPVSGGIYVKRSLQENSKRTSAIKIIAPGE